MVHISPIWFSRRAFAAILVMAVASGCGGGSSSSGAGQGRGIVNVPTAPQSYVTPAGVQVRETTQIRPIGGATCADLLAGDVTAHARYDIRWGPDRVTVDVRFEYPAWQPTGNPRPALVSEWSRYIGALQVHEHGHRDIGVRAANLMMRDGADRQALLRQAQQQDRDYDAQTNGGATQGARFRCN